MAKHRIPTSETVTEYRRALRRVMKACALAKRWHKPGSPIREECDAAMREARALYHRLGQRA